jgi:hypothetical protein
METMENEKELSLALSQFLKLIYVDFGINKFNDRIRNWYELTWDEFRKELENQSVRFNDCLVSDWQDFFHKHKAKVHGLIR